VHLYLCFHYDLKCSHYYWHDNTHLKNCDCDLIVQFSNIILWFYFTFFYPLGYYMLRYLIIAFNSFHLYSNVMSLQFNPFFKNFFVLHLRFLILMILFSPFKNLWFLFIMCHSIVLSLPYFLCWIKML
jgi:hypothetical protein